MRLFTDGAEMGDVLFFDSPVTTVATTEHPATGTYCYIMGGWISPFKVIDDVSEFYFKERYYSGQIQTPIIFRHSTNNVVDINIDLLGRWTARVATTVVATASVLSVLNTWMVIEVYVKIALTTGRIILRIDGNEFIDFTGDTTWIDGPDHIDNLQWSTAVGGCWLDDLAMNDISDTDGKGDISWCGAGKVIKLTPDESGSTSDWMGSDEDQVENFRLVDDYPSNSDTDYIYADGETPGTKDKFCLTDFVLTDVVIQRIWVEARARKTSGDPDTLKVGVRPLDYADVMSDEIALYETYRRIVGDELILNPDGDDVWDATMLEELQLVVEVG